MATRLVHELTYDAPASTVAAMLADPAFREQVCAAQRATSYTVGIDQDGGTTTVTIEMEQPTDRVPSFARKLVGATTSIVQSETWHSPTRADVHITIPGKPGEMSGTAVLAETDGVTTETVDLEVTVRIPLVGGKIEELLVTLLTSALKAEQRVGRAYLA